MLKTTKFKPDIQENITTYLHSTAEQIDNCLRVLLEKHDPSSKCRTLTKTCFSRYDIARDQLCTPKDIALKQKIFCIHRRKLKSKLLQQNNSTAACVHCLRNMTHQANAGH